MGSVICIITALADNSSFELSSFRVIELFFYFLLVSILVSYLVKYYKYVFDYYKYTLYLLYTL